MPFVGVVSVAGDGTVDDAIDGGVDGAGVGQKDTLPTKKFVISMFVVVLLDCFWGARFPHARWGFGSADVLASTRITNSKRNQQIFYLD